MSILENINKMELVIQLLNTLKKTCKIKNYFMIEWKDIVGYEGLYKISNDGQVYSLISNKYLKFRFVKDGYYGISLFKKSFLIHRLVAQAFIPNPHNKLCIDHINTIRTDNRVENLRWCTHKENCNNPLTKHKLSESNKGKNSPNYGKHLCEETRHKLSEALKGRQHSEESKLKMKNVARKRTKQIIQLSLDGEAIRIWDGLWQIEEELGFIANYIGACCKGKYKTAYGFKWKYYE